MLAQDQIEKKIVTIWTDVLKMQDIETTDDFFDLGGTSLGMISVVLRMSEHFKVPLDTAIVAEGATVGSLAKCVKDRLEIQAKEAV
jgi:acyl carrier protein